jgi:transposase
MYIVEVPTKTSTGKLSHVCVLLRESFREKGKVKTRTLANLTHLKREVIEAIKIALKSPEKVLNVNLTNNSIKTKSGLSIGSVWCVYQIAKRLGIVKALGETDSGKLALIQVIARVIDQGSRLSATRLAASHAICDIVGIEKTFNEDHLYNNLEWISKNQDRIEKVMFKTRKVDADLFLYDVTSSYLEGEENHFGRYGYNRDKKKGKKQIVLGLLCDKEGNPVSIKVYEGNTSDPVTLKDHIKKIKEDYKCERVTFVGDKGMIKSGQMEDLERAGFHYITSISKSQIETLLKENTIQLELFDDKIYEVEKEGIRYILRRNPIRAKEVKENRVSKMNKIREMIEEKNKYLREHRKAKLDKTENKIKEKINSLKLSKYVNVSNEGREIKISIDEKKLRKIEELDGCYIIQTDISKEIPAEIIHSRYKDLSKVEWAFRTSKTTFLEMRPWYVRTEASTKGHAVVVMLSYQIVKALGELWKEENNTVKEILMQLSSICSVEIEMGENVVLNQIPVPRQDLKRFLEKADITLPSYLSKSKVNVVSRKHLAKERKSYQHH